MPDPAFDASDRVDQPPTLPAELEGKSATEIAQYYATREQNILRNAKDIMEARGITDQPDLTPKRTEVRTDTPRPLTNTTGLPDSAKQTLIQGALLMARQSPLVDQKVWEKFQGEITAIMSGMDEPSRMSSDMWLAAYQNVAGRHLSELRAESVTEHVRSSEPPPPPPAEVNAPPRQLSPAEQRVVEGLRRQNHTVRQADGSRKPFDSEAYLQASKRMEEGRWPLTFNQQ